jgi:hypothetical protein
MPLVTAQAHSPALHRALSAVAISDDDRWVPTIDDLQCFDNTAR